MTCDVPKLKIRPGFASASNHGGARYHGRSDKSLAMFDALYRAYNACLLEWAPAMLATANDPEISAYGRHLKRIAAAKTKRAEIVSRYRAECKANPKGMTGHRKAAARRQLETIDARIAKLTDVAHDYRRNREFRKFNSAYIQIETVSLNRKRVSQILTRAKADMESPARQGGPVTVTANALAKVWRGQVFPELNVKQGPNVGPAMENVHSD